MKKRLLATALSSLMIQAASADCVFGAKLKINYVLVNQNTIILKGGPGPDILIKSFHFFVNGRAISVLKDSFCDFESAVLLDGDEPVDIQQVKRL